MTDFVIHSAPSSESFVYTLKQLHRMDCNRKQLIGERERELELELENFIFQGL